MKKQEILALCISDACKNEPWALLGLLDWVIEKGYGLERILKMSERLGIPRDTALITIYQIYPEAFN